VRLNTPLDWLADKVMQLDKLFLRENLVFELLFEAQVIESAQIKSKVLGQTHMFYKHSLGDVYQSLIQ